MSSSLRIKQEYDVKTEPIPELKTEPEIVTEETKLEVDPSSLTDSVSKRHASILLEKVVFKLTEIGFLTDAFSFGGTKYTV